MKFLIILTLAVAASAFPEQELVHRNRVMPVQDDIEGRIAGGSKASPGQFPFQVGLSLKMNAFQASWCGGSLIGPTWVLTAAHCADGIVSVTVYLGATQRNEPEVTHTVPKSEITIHPGWNAKTLKDDIALIRIPAVSPTPRIQYAKLPPIANSYSTYAGLLATIIGWGLEGDKASAVAANLNYAQVTIISNADCKRVFGTIITDTNICISTVTFKSTCQGDSGGPLMLDSNKQIVGVTSFGAAAGCEKGYPAAFTRTTEYLVWIKFVTNIG